MSCRRYVNISVFTCHIAVQASGITVNAYMGKDSVAPFLKDSGRAVFVLCKTSNKSSADFQTLPVGGGRQLFEQVAKVAQDEWNADNNVGLVIGATDIEVC